MSRPVSKTAPSFPEEIICFCTELPETKLERRKLQTGRKRAIEPAPRNLNSALVILITSFVARPQTVSVVISTISRQADRKFTLRPGRNAHNSITRFSKRSPEERRREHGKAPNPRFDGPFPA